MSDRLADKAGLGIWRAGSHCVERQLGSKTLFQTCFLQNWGGSGSGGGRSPKVVKMLRYRATNMVIYEQRGQIKFSLQAGVVFRQVTQFVIHSIPIELAALQ